MPAIRKNGAATVDVPEPGALVPGVQEGMVGGLQHPEGDGGRGVDDAHAHGAPATNPAAPEEPDRRDREAHGTAALIAALVAWYSQERSRALPPLPFDPDEDLGDDGSHEERRQPEDPVERGRAPRRGTTT